MTSFLVVKPKVIAEASSAVGNISVIFQINPLIFHRPPEPFDHNIVKRTALTVHADPKRVTFERFDKLIARVLSSLIGIEDFGASDPERVLNTVNAKLRIERCRKLPCYHVTTEPVEDRRQINEASRQSDIRNIRRPNLIRVASRDG